MNKKKVFNIVVILIGLFFVIKKFYKSAEYSNVKRINEIYYSGEYNKAKSELELHLLKYPKSSESWAYLGLINIELNDTIGAEKAYLKGLELDSKNDKAIIGLGVIQRMKGNYEKARNYYEKAIKLNPKNPDSYSSLLVLEIKNKNYQKAVELGEKAKELKLTDTRPGILGNLVVAYHLNNQSEERDNVLAELEKMDYEDIEYIKMIISGMVDINDFI
ncbi:tetratricopeptide repeat protein [Psychroserpens mesophilus]|uniref:tetratricopeptide repeat protein n=1 Tax=Psychroserpens mesophilus TaxID=325473 RepID=UPI000693516E|nr:tetratricopeptide repeat protein [Psychroserpens mesophilus]